MSSLSNAASFLVNIVFDLYIFVLLLRMLLQKFGASWHNPVSQFVIKITEPVLKPFRKFIPGFKGVDLSILVVAILLEMIEMWLMMWLRFNALPGIAGTVVVAIGELGMKAVNIFFYAVIISAICSWFPNLRGNPLISIVEMIAQPVLRPFRQLIPMVAGFDLSPIVAIIALVLVNMLVFGNIIAFGIRLAF